MTTVYSCLIQLRCDGGKSRSSYTHSQSDERLIFIAMSGRPLAAARRHLRTGFPEPSIPRGGCLCIEQCLPMDHYGQVYIRTYIHTCSTTSNHTCMRSALYDSVASVRLNHQGTVSDSVLVMGGFDGATGSVLDGSSGGMLGDMWCV